MGLTLYIAGSIGKFTSASEFRMTIATQKSFRRFYDFWVLDGVDDSGNE